MRTVTPPTRTGSSSANGCRSPNLPTFQCTAIRRVLAVVGGNFHATAQRGSRPDRAEPALQLEVGDLDDDAVDLEVERAAAALPLQALRDDRLLVVEHDDLLVDGEAVLAQPPEHLPLVGQLEPLDDADRRRPTATAAARAASAGSSWRIVPGRRVARVHERRAALRGVALVERLRSPGSDM